MNALAVLRRIPPVLLGGIRKIWLVGMLVLAMLPIKFIYNILYEYMNGKAPHLTLLVVALLLFVMYWLVNQVIETWPYRSHWDLKVTDDAFFVGFKEYSFEEISHIRFFYLLTKKRVNFFPAGEDHSVMLELSINTQRKPIKFLTGPIVFSTISGSIGSWSAAKLSEKIRILSLRSFQKRYNAYLSQMQYNGYFVYDGKKIHANGDIDYPEGTINIKSTVPLRKLPFTIYHEVRKAKLFKDGDIRTISTQVDADVFFALLDRLFGVRFAD